MYALNATGEKTSDGRVVCHRVISGSKVVLLAIRTSISGAIDLILSLTESQSERPCDFGVWTMTRLRVGSKVLSVP
jgi:hypothetical protein